MVKTGYWKSWFIAVKPAISAMAAPNKIQSAITPNIIQMPRINVFFRLPALALRPMIFIGITGNTHGVKFNKKPPPIATRSNKSKPIGPSAESENVRPKASKLISLLFGALTPAWISAKTVASKLSNILEGVVSKSLRVEFPAATMFIVFVKPYSSHPHSSGCGVDARQVLSSQAWKIGLMVNGASPSFASLVIVTGI